MRHELSATRRDDEPVLIIGVDRTLTKEGHRDIVKLAPALTALIGKGAYRCWYDDERRELVIRINAAAPPMPRK